MRRAFPARHGGSARGAHHRSHASLRRAHHLLADGSRLRVHRRAQRHHRARLLLREQRLLGSGARRDAPRCAAALLEGGCPGRRDPARSADRTRGHGRRRATRRRWIAIIRSPSSDFLAWESMQRSHPRWARSCSSGPASASAWPDRQRYLGTDERGADGGRQAAFPRSLAASGRLAASRIAGSTRSGSTPPASTTDNRSASRLTSCSFATGCRPSRTSPTSIACRRRGSPWSHCR